MGARLMFEFKGMWLPDGEKHFPAWCEQNGEMVNGRTTYQIRKWRACVPWIRNWRCAVDVGGHCGFWSIQMVQRFGITHAFEPMAQLRECFDANLGDIDHGEHDFSGNVPCVLWPFALGVAPGRVRMNYNPADTGNTHVGGDGDIEMRTLDSFEFQNVDFIKIDCEGYEHHVIEGARETIQRCKPCVIVEQKQHIMAKTFGTKGTPAVDLLKSWGYTVRAALSGDYILVAD